MHFYTKTEDGAVEPRHFVENKSSGGLRPSRTTDAKKALMHGEKWMPSITGIIGLLDKPALLNWKVDKHLEQAYAFPAETDCESWIKEIKVKTSEAMEAAPQAGTDFHQIMEDYMNGKEVPAEFHRHCVAVEMVVLDNCGTQEWQTEKMLISEIGYGGTADLISDEWTIDYKTKQFAKQWKPGKMAYTDHARQLAALNMADSAGRDRRAANVFICLETGEVEFYEHESEALDNAWLDFKALLGIYHRNTYNPLELK